MKFLFALTAIMIASAAQAQVLNHEVLNHEVLNHEVLNCKGGTGGPGPATAVLVLQPVQDGQYSVEMTLTNPDYPNGIKGSFIGTIDPETHWLGADGKIGTIAGNITLMSSSDGSTLLAVYADDRSIEFGFGAHLDCK